MSQNTNYTSEQRAIRQHLSKPEPYSSACGCMGPQRLDEKTSWDPYTKQLRITNVGENHIKIAKVIRSEISCGLDEVFQYLSNDTMSIEVPIHKFKDLQQRLTDAGAKYEIVIPISNLYPLCPCQMKYVEEVDGVFYRIITHRSPDGITHSTEELGPRGGPYKNTEWK